MYLRLFRRLDRYVVDEAYGNRCGNTFSSVRHDFIRIDVADDDRRKIENLPDNGYIGCSFMDRTCEACQRAGFICARKRVRYRCESDGRKGNENRVPTHSAERYIDYNRYADA